MSFEEESNIIPYIYFSKPKYDVYNSHYTDSSLSINMCRIHHLGCCRIHQEFRLGSLVYR